MLRKKIISKSVSVGSWITLAHPAIAEIMACSGFDWLAVDLEHSVISYKEAEGLIHVIKANNIIPLVRLTSNDPDQIKKMMDAGAHGIIVPMVKTPEDAIKAILSAKYPPLGRRGVGLARAQGYGAKFKEYINWQENFLSVIVQIEHIDAVDNLEEILKVEGVDGFMVGPYDLSGSMGIPGEFANEEFIKVLNKINMIASKVGKPKGIHIIEPNLDELACRINEGYSFIAYSIDTRMIDNACQKAMKKLEEISKS